MPISKIVRSLGVALLMAIPTVLLEGGGPSATKTYQVTITNLTGGIVVDSGIHGVGDLAPAQFDWKNPVANITITAE